MNTNPRRIALQAAPPVSVVMNTVRRWGGTATDAGEKIDEWVNQLEPVASFYLVMKEMSEEFEWPGMSPFLVKNHLDGPFVRDFLGKMTVQAVALFPDVPVDGKSGCVHRHYGLGLHGVVRVKHGAYAASLNGGGRAITKAYGGVAWVDSWRGPSEDGVPGGRASTTRSDGDGRGATSEKLFATGFLPETWSIMCGHGEVKKMFEDLYIRHERNLAKPGEYRAVALGAMAATIHGSNDWPITTDY